jgi:DNA-binding response OmpR family regulator
MMKRILVVEDDHNVSLALTKRLTANGFSVGNAFDAAAAVTEARKSPPDLIILDLMLPAGGGAVALQRIRKFANLMSVPTIVLTAMRDPFVRDMVAELGVHGYFEKPYDSGELLAAIHEALAAPVQ